MSEHMDLISKLNFAEDGIVSQVIRKSDKTNHTLFCMSSGSDISEHTSTREATVTVISGKGVFTLDSEDIDLKPGVFIHMDPGAAHALKSEDNLAFVLSLYGE